MQTIQPQTFRVRSYALAVYLIAVGFECRGAIDDNGRPVYLFDSIASAVFPTFKAIKLTLDEAARSAGL